MPCSHLSDCIQASYYSPVLQMKMRVRAPKEQHHSVRRVYFHVCINVCVCVFSQYLVVLRYDDELPGYQQKTIEGKQSKPLNLSAICAHILYTHVMSILAQLLGQGSAGLGPGPFSRDNPPTPPPSPPPSPFLCSLWTHSEATRLHNSSQKNSTLQT